MGLYKFAMARARQRGALAESRPGDPGGSSAGGSVGRRLRLCYKRKKSPVPESLRSRFAGPVRLYALFLLAGLAGLAACAPRLSQRPAPLASEPGKEGYGLFLLTVSCWADEVAAQVGATRPWAGSGLAGEPPGQKGQLGTERRCWEAVRQIYGHRDRARYQRFVALTSDSIEAAANRIAELAARTPEEGADAAALAILTRAVGAANLETRELWAVRRPRLAGLTAEQRLELDAVTHQPEPLLRQLGTLAPGRLTAEARALYVLAVWTRFESFRRDHFLYAAADAFVALSEPPPPLPGRSGQPAAALDYLVAASRAAGWENRIDFHSAYPRERELFALAGIYAGLAQELAAAVAQLTPAAPTALAASLKQRVGALEDTHVSLRELALPRSGDSCGTRMGARHGDVPATAKEQQKEASRLADEKELRSRKYFFVPVTYLRAATRKQALTAAQAETQQPLMQRRPPGLAGLAGLVGDGEAPEALSVAAARAVADLGSADPALAEAALRQLRYLGQAAYPQLLTGLASEQAQTRKWSAVLLGSLGPAAVAPLSRVLRSDREPLLRGVAAAALADTYDPQAVPALLGALAKEEDLGLLTSIIHALAVLRDPRAVAPLVRLIPSRAFQGQLQRAAAEALYSFAPAEAKRAIAELLAREPDPDQQRNLSAVLLSAPPQYPYWPPELLPLHQRTLDAARLAGERFKEPELAELLACIDSPLGSVAADCLHALGTLRAESAVPAISALGPRSRAALAALAMIASPAAIERLLTAVQSVDKSVREPAIEALRHAGRWSVPILIELLADESLRRHEPPAASSPSWPEEHLAHRVLQSVLAAAGLRGRDLNLAHGGSFDLDAEIRAVRMWWRRYGEAFLRGAVVPSPNLTAVLFMT